MTEPANKLRELRQEIVDSGRSLKDWDEVEAIRKGYEAELSSLRLKVENLKRRLKEPETMLVLREWSL